MAKSKLAFLLILFIGVSACKKDSDELVITNEVIESFRNSTGIDAIYEVDTTLLNTVEGWQGSGSYPGVDEWATAVIPNDFPLYGGLPGQSEYYTIAQTLVDTDTMQTAYWESLQVQAHPTLGYRPMVGVFDLEQRTVVAIAKTLANPQFGEGGAWQIYVENYETILTVKDTIILKEQ